MCELFAMSSSHPATVRLSMEEFARHGGLSGPHSDGWGIGQYEGHDVRLVREPRAASDSACLRFLRQEPLRGTLVLSHIRKATRGPRSLANCQPFARELGGRMHLFAHNGSLDDAGLRVLLPPGKDLPVGDTDSEYAFCALLELLRPAWRGAASPPSVQERLAIVSRFAALLRPLGPANFVYADGELLFLHGHRRTHPDGIRPPGLHVLCRSCATDERSLTTPGLSIVAPGAALQQVVLAASVPLTTDEAWRALGDGELLVAQGGRLLAPPARSDGTG